MALDDVEHVRAVAIISLLVESAYFHMPPGQRARIKDWLVENHPPPTAYMAAMRASVAEKPEASE